VLTRCDNSINPVIRFLIGDCSVLHFHAQVTTNRTLHESL